MPFRRHIQTSLATLRDNGLLREPRLVSGDQGPIIRLDGRDVLSFCSNNYLGLANHPQIAQAATDAMQQYGYGAGASRHISGTHSLHREAERALAAFTGREAALYFSTGYAANVGTVQALVGRGDVLFSDSLNHASLIDGCVLSRATTHVYRHCDTQHLDSLLTAHRAEGRTALVLSDAGFSMDGDLAPLAKLREVCDRHGAGLLVDEAHTLGVLGDSGRGLAEQTNVTPDLTIGTLGKAFGVAGAFVAGDADAVQLIENRARSYVFSTAPSPSQAAATIAATKLVHEGHSLRTRVHRNAHVLREGLVALGIQVLAGPLPILPVLTGDPSRTMRLSRELLDQGVFVHGIRPPTVPTGSSRLRVTTTAAHTDEHITSALHAFSAVAESYHA